jgi:hypothetical protein
LSIDARGPIVLEFNDESGGASVRIPYREIRNQPAQLQITDARLNGGSLDTSRLELIVRPGESVSGIVTLRYTAPTPIATWWLGATSNWGDPARSFASFGALNAPALDRIRREAVTFTAPTDPGTYYYIFAMGMESNAAFLFSGTNWVVGGPDWEKGDVIARWPASTIERAMRSGSVDGLVYRRYEGKLGHFGITYGATAVRVVVRASATPSAPSPS